MARVCRHYERQDFSELLSELHGGSTGANAAQPASGPTQVQAVVSPAARKRASLMSDPKMRYAYSILDNTLHDRDCEALKAIRDEDFRMLADFDADRPVCHRCYRRAVIRSGIGDDVKHINAYVHILDRLQATTKDLRELILMHGARLSSIATDRVVIKVHDDRWMICFLKDTPLLYHNNYTVTEDLRRFFDAGYHIQNDGGIRTFHSFARIMTSYSWEAHVARLKARALAEQQAEVRAQLSGISNRLRVPRFSLLNAYFTVVDCNRRLDRLLRKNGVRSVITAQEPIPDSPYRLVTCRVRRWQQKRFLKATEALKEYTVIKGHYDYAAQCVGMIGGKISRPRRRFPLPW